MMVIGRLRKKSTFYGLNVGIAMKTFTAVQLIGA